MFVGNEIQREGVFCFLVFFFEMCLSLFKLLLTEFHRVGGLNNKNLFLTVLKAGKAEISVPA